MNAFQHIFQRPQNGWNHDEKFTQHSRWPGPVTVKRYKHTLKTYHSFGRKLESVKTVRYLVRSSTWIKC